MASLSDGFWLALNRFKSSRWGLLLYYAYLGGILVAGLVAVLAISGNHDIAVRADRAAKEAKTAATAAGIAAAQANRSLCFQKRAIDGQLAAAKTFLAHNPDGTADFSRALILNAIHNDAVDAAALANVRCPRNLRTR